jgi:hypothetical protein
MQVLVSGQPNLLRSQSTKFLRDMEYSSLDSVS